MFLFVKSEISCCTFCKEGLGIVQTNSEVGTLHTLEVIWWKLQCVDVDFTLDFFLPLQPVLHDKKNTAWWAFSCSFEWYMICWVYSPKKSKFSGNKINGFYVSGFFVRWRPFSPKRNIKMESPETKDSGKVYMLG